MKNIKIIIISLAVVIGVIFIFNLINNNKSNRDLVISYIEKKGFVKEDGSSLYFKEYEELSRDEFDRKVEQKENTYYEGMYFNVDSYKLTADRLEYSDLVYTSFNPTYDYVSNKLDYVYYVEIENSSIIMEGLYDGDTKNFSCDVRYEDGFNGENAVDSICNKILYDVEDFWYYAITLITRHDIREKMLEEKNT